MGVGILIGMAIGATVGGVSSAIQGGNILQGMLLGGTIGAVTGGVGSLAGGAGAAAATGATAGATAGTTAAATGASSGFMSGLHTTMASTAFSVGSHAVSWGTVAATSVAGLAGGQTAVMQSIGNGQTALVMPDTEEELGGVQSDPLADRQAKLRALAIAQNDTNNNSFSINPANGGQAKTDFISNSILGSNSQSL